MVVYVLETQKGQAVISELVLIIYMVIFTREILFYYMLFYLAFSFMHLIVGGNSWYILYLRVRKYLAHLNVLSVK